jgi:DNA-binding NarL/FixJ family response regulator
MGANKGQRPKPYRVVLADNHGPLREGLKTILAEQVDLEVVGEVEDGVELLALLERSLPDLVVLDVSMPKFGGFEATREIKKLYPCMKVLILTMHKSREYLRHALSAGADGYSLMQDATTEFFSAVQTIKRGGIYISPLLTRESG